MEAPFDALLNRTNPAHEKKRSASQSVKAQAASSLHSAGLRGLNASNQKQQIIVPSCSTGRSANQLKSVDSSSAFKKSLAPIAVVLSKDQRVTAKPKLLLSPLLFLSNQEKSKRENHDNVQSKALRQPERRPQTVYARKTSINSAKLSVQSKNLQENEVIDHVERDSSVEAEDSLGTLLSKHFETDTAGEDNRSTRSPSSEIAKKRILHEKARIRHICHVCNRECPSKHKLKRHLSTHTEERPFVCQMCGKTFKWIGYLQKHIRQQHSNRVDNSPKSPSISTASPQSQVAPDTPSFSASLDNTSGPEIIEKRRKKHKSRTRQSESSQSIAFSEATTASHGPCPHHCEKSRQDQTSSADPINPEGTPAQKDNTENEPLESLIVSIPRIHKATSVGMSTTSENTQQNRDDEIHLMLDSSINIEQSEPSSFSSAVTAIMAEPVPSNCIQTNQAQDMTGVLDANSQCADFTQDFQYCFPLNSTSNNNADTLLSYDCSESQLLNTAATTSSFSSYSPGLMHVPMSTSSDSIPMSNSIPNKASDSMNFSAQQDAQSGSSMDPNHSGVNFTSTLQQPPDLIPVASQFDPLGTDSQFDQQLSDIIDFDFSDSSLNNHYPICANQTFDGDSLLNNLSMPGTDFGQSMGLGMADNIMSSPTFFDIQQAQQLLYENSQQMKRILRNYQTLQNTLLQVTAGAMLSSGSAYNQLNMNTMPIDQQMTPQLLLNNSTDQMFQPDHLQASTLAMQTNLNQPQIQPQDYLAQQNNHVISNAQNPLSQPLNQVDHSESQLQNRAQLLPTPASQPMNQPTTAQYLLAELQNQSENEIIEQLQSLNSDNSTKTQTRQPSLETPQDISDNTTQITCEPDELLNPLIRTEDLNLERDLSHPVEKFPRLDNSSCFDAGIQCELGPETLVALLQEEKVEEESQMKEQLETPIGLCPSAPQDLLANVATTSLQNTPNTSLVQSVPLAATPSHSSTPPILLANVPPILETNTAKTTLQTLTNIMSTSNESPSPEAISVISPSNSLESDGEGITLRADRMVNKYRCTAEGCNKAYLHRKDLTHHIKIRHGKYVLPKMLKPVAMEATEKPYVCDVVSCGRSYHHLRDLRRHQRNCHEGTEAEANGDSNAKKDQIQEHSIYGKIQLRFPCDYPGCVRSYVHKKDLVRHKRLYHKDLSSKPSVPVPLPYSDTDLQLIRQEVKQEVEQLIKNARRKSTSSSCSSVSSTTTDISGLPSPDALISSLSNDVFVSLGIVPPLIELDKEPVDTTINANTAKILSLIQNLTTSSPQVGDIPIPQFPLPITVPVIPVVTDGYINRNNSVSSRPRKSGKTSKNCVTLKQVLSEPTKSLAPPVKTKVVPAKGSEHKKADAISLTMQRSNNSILDISPQEIVDALKIQTSKEANTRSPDTLANLAAAALSPSESELSNILAKTVSGPAPPTFSTEAYSTLSPVSNAQVEPEERSLALDIGAIMSINPEIEAISSPFEGDNLTSNTEFFAFPDIEPTPGGAKLETIKSTDPQSQAISSSFETKIAQSVQLKNNIALMESTVTDEIANADTDIPSLDPEMEALASPFEHCISPGAAHSEDITDLMDSILAVEITDMDIESSSVTEC